MSTLSNLSDEEDYKKLMKREYKSIVSKENHSEIERRRRLTMNHYISELVTIFSRGNSGNKKLNKIYVLKMAVTYLKRLKEARLNEPKHSISFMTSEELQNFALDALIGFEIKIKCYNGKILYVSNDVDCVLGCKKEALLETKIFDIIHEDDIDKLKRQLNLHIQKPYQLFDLKKGLINGEYKRNDPLVVNRNFSIRMKCFNDDKINKEYFCPKNKYTYKYNNYIYAKSQRNFYNSGKYLLLECRGVYKPSKDGSSDLLHLIVHLSDCSLLQPETSTNQTCIKLSMDGNIIFTEKNNEILVGYEDEELMNCPLAMFIHNEDQSLYYEILCTAKKTVDPIMYFLRIRILNKSGNYSTAKMHFKCIQSVFTKTPELFQIILEKETPIIITPEIVINEDSQSNKISNSGFPSAPSLSPLSLSRLTPCSSPNIQYNTTDQYNSMEYLGPNYTYDRVSEVTDQQSYVIPVTYAYQQLPDQTQMMPNLYSKPLPHMADMQMMYQQNEYDSYYNRVNYIPPKNEYSNQMYLPSNYYYPQYQHNSYLSTNMDVQNTFGTNTVYYPSETPNSLQYNYTDTYNKKRKQ